MNSNTPRTEADLRRYLDSCENNLIEAVTELTAARATIARLEGGIRVLQAACRASDAQLNKFIDRVQVVEAEKTRLEAEVKRLNDWANTFTDAHLKERQTGDALVKEVRAQLAAKEAELQALKQPTMEMQIAGMEASVLGCPSVDDESYVLSIWNAMLSAAPIERINHDRRLRRHETEMARRSPRGTRDPAGG